PSPRTSRVVRYAVGASSLVALLTLIEHVTGFGLGIDQLLVLDPDSGPTAPGRMAATTAVSLLLLNAALYLTSQPERYTWVQGLAAGGMFIATLNGVGYVFGPDPSGISTWGAMAVHTA